MLLKVLFFGSSQYCLPVLESLKKDFNLIAVVTKKGKYVENFALSHNIKVYSPQDKKELLALKKILKEHKPDLAIVADYGLIIPKDVFSIPKYKTLNIHFSKLPKFRGPSPVQYTLLMGEKTAGISIIAMDEEMDTGDIVWQKPFDYAQDKETAKSLYTKLFNIASSSLSDVINKYVKNELKPQKQDNSKATYTKHFTRQDGFIPYQVLDCATKGINPSPQQVSAWPLINIFPPEFLILNSKFLIEKALRAFSPWPGVWTEITLPNNKFMPDSRDRLNLSSKTKKRLKILKAHLETDLLPDRKAKTIPDRKVRLILDVVQLEGKKPVSWKQFKEGYSNLPFS